MNDEENELLKQVMFADLAESKVDVRAPCAHCAGRGTKHGARCPICDGDKTVTQSMSLYALAKKMLPFFINELKLNPNREG